MPPNPIEEILTQLPKRGTLVKDRGYRQVWRFVFDGRPYFLKFYPRQSTLKRLFRGNPALREFQRLQTLQKASIPSPRAHTALVGFRLNGEIGDAVVIAGIEPSIPLDQYLNEFKLTGQPIPDHRRLVRQVIDIVARLGRAGFTHGDLHLGNFLLYDSELYLLDGYAVRPGGLKLQDVLLLGHSVNRFATRTDLYRGWLELGAGRQMPRTNSASRRQWRKFLERATEENPWFGKLSVGDWHGHYFKQSKYARRWAGASTLNFDAVDWQSAWPAVWEKIQNRKATLLKSSPSGDVWETTATVHGSSLAIVVKRPYKRYWYRYFNEIGRGSRARRAWIKSWKLIARNIPTAWPLLLLEKRTVGYVTDNIIVFERIEGQTLAALDLDALSPSSRDLMFHRVGRILRQIDSMGMAHFDAKASNWMITDDPQLGPRPVLIDVDGVRWRRWIALGIRRLLRSMRDHPQYTPADSLSLCCGYAPYSRIALEPEPNAAHNPEPSPPSPSHNP